MFTTEQSSGVFHVKLTGSRTLNIPAIGLGTFSPQPAPVDTVKQAVLEALKAGYRHFDTAFGYGTGVSEQGLGEAVREWGGNREELFIVSKLFNAHHEPQDVEAALRLSLENLGLEYLDLYLMHFPVAYKREGDKPREWTTVRGEDKKPVIDYELTRNVSATWKAMESLVDKGLVKAIGISNFNILKTRKLLETARIKPAVNQVELHPYLPQHELLAFCKEQGIHVTAHSPLGGRPVDAVAPNKHFTGPLEDPIVNDLAKNHGKTPAAILLKWAVQRGTSVVPKSFNTERIRENLEAVAGPDLSGADMKALTNLLGPGDEIRYNDPRFYYKFDIYDEENDQPVKTEK